MDLRNGVRYFKRPRIEKHFFLEFSTTDGLRLYPRVKTRKMDENSFVLRMRWAMEPTKGCGSAISLCSHQSQTDYTCSRRK